MEELKSTLSEIIPFCLCFSRSRRNVVVEFLRPECRLRLWNVASKQVSNTPESSTLPTLPCRPTSRYNGMPLDNSSECTGPRPMQLPLVGIPLPRNIQSLFVWSDAFHDQVYLTVRRRGTSEFSLWTSVCAFVVVFVGQSVGCVFLRVCLSDIHNIFFHHPFGYCAVVVVVVDVVVCCFWIMGGKR